MDVVELTSGCLSVDKVSSQVACPSAGAISLFVGTTRNNFDRKKVLKLEYEAYEPMARKEMLKICKKLRSMWKVENVAMYHRLGEVPVGEISVVLAISSAHRRDSLESIKFAIDSLKASVPIWKKEVYADGAREWKQNKECLWSVQNSETKSSWDQEAETLTDSSAEISVSRTSQDQKGGAETDPSTENELEFFHPLPMKADQLKKTKVSMDKNVFPSSSEEVEANEEVADGSLVQIQADNVEIKRRIAAFIRRKRAEVDQANLREFCNRSFSADTTCGDSCARTDAVFNIRRKDSKSHVKVSRVVNQWGPQTDFSQQLEPLSSVTKQPSFPPPDSFQVPQPLRTSGIEERIMNLERWLIPNPAALLPVPSDVYSRLKQLEERVMFLEGVSPDYFSPAVKKIKTEKNEDQPDFSSLLDVSRLDERINQLRAELRRKLRK